MHKLSSGVQNFAEQCQFQVQGTRSGDIYLVSFTFMDQFN